MSGFQTKLGLMFIELNPLYFEGSHVSHGSCHRCNKNYQFKYLQNVRSTY